MAHLLSYDAEDWGSANGGGPVGPSGAQATGAAGDADALAELSSADEASYEERAAGLVGGAEAVVSEGMVGLVVGHGGGHKVPPAAAPETAEQGGQLQQRQRQQQQQQQQQGLDPEAVGESQLDGSFCYWDHEGEPSSAGIPLQPQLQLPEGLDSIPGPLPSVSGSSTSSGRASSRRPGSTGGCGGSSSTSMDC